MGAAVDRGGDGHAEPADRRPCRYTVSVDRDDWDRRYLEQELLWSAEPSRFLVEEAGTRRRLVETGQGAVYEIDCLVRARAPR